MGIFRTKLERELKKLEKIKLLEESKLEKINSLKEQEKEAEEPDQEAEPDLQKATLQELYNSMGHCFLEIARRNGGKNEK